MTIFPIAPPTAVLDEFRALLQAARESGDTEPTAMTVATAGADGNISARTVLLKDVDARGFVFYSNFNSNKGRDLQENPRAALLFLWKMLRLQVSPEGDTGRQVSPEGDTAKQVQAKIEGQVETVTAREADDYFASRPRESQIGAWASMQSETLDSRDVLTQRIAEFTAKFEGVAVPRPPHWSGFRVLPNMIEFWYGAPFRLHERVRHEFIGGSWQTRLLFP
jgi:pyridoxamine 5'-phosphate oxidase